MTTIPKDTLSYYFGNLQLNDWLVQDPTSRGQQTTRGSGKHQSFPAAETPTTAHGAGIKHLDPFQEIINLDIHLNIKTAPARFLCVATPRPPPPFRELRVEISEEAILQLVKLFTKSMNTIILQLNTNTRETEPADLWLKGALLNVLCHGLIS